MSKKITIGGQAVIEGVMMRSTDKYAVAVRTPEGKITTKTFPIKDHWINKIPLLRGFYRFIETLIIGLESLSYSASESMEEEEEMSRFEMFLTLMFSLLLTIVLFVMAPLFIANFFLDKQSMWFNLVDGLFRLLIFLGYLLVISLMPDVKRIFQYHGAEHKTVFAYENKEKLKVKNIKKYSTLHPRCGTSFILIVLVISIFVFSFIKTDTLLLRFGYRILLLPVITGISYEYLRFAGKYHNHPLVKITVFPGLLLQKITTKEPEDDMIEVAIAAIKKVT